MPEQLNERCQEFVASLIDYFERESDNNGPLLPLTAVRERVAAALNLSMYTVSAISQKKKNEALKSPRKRKTTKRVTNTSLLDTGAIRNTIYTMYERRQHITLSSLLEKLREKELFHGCRMSLCSLLKEIGFKWKKDDPRRGLLELSKIALKRVDFLRSYIENKEESLYKFVFLDETWIFEVARNKPESIFVVDQLAEQYGHKVLRLPPYHCMFNPIELIWGISKSYYNKHVGKGGTSNENFLNMWREALLFVTPEIWKNSIKHRENEIRKGFDREHLFDRQEIQPININIGNDSESSSYDSDR